MAETIAIYKLVEGGERERGDRVNRPLEFKMSLRSLKWRLKYYNREEKYII